MKIEITDPALNGKITVSWSTRSGHNTTIETPKSTITCSTGSAGEAVEKALDLAIR